MWLKAECAATRSGGREGETEPGKPGTAPLSDISVQSTGREPISYSSSSRGATCGITFTFECLSDSRLIRGKVELFYPGAFVTLRLLDVLGRIVAVDLNLMAIGIAEVNALGRL
jgi:hypothetical protein